MNFMKFKAYILAADPNWIEASVLSYYDFVEEILVSYDLDGRGWSGKPIPVEECLKRLHAIDKDKKLRLLGGNYYRSDRSPMQNDTYQRQCAIDEIGDTADWIVELDTDEVLPNASSFFKSLEKVPKDRTLVEWPMRVFFQKTPSGKFLEVTTFFRKQLSEFPGPVATRPGVKVDNARCSSAATRWHFDIGPTTYVPELKSRKPVDGIIAKDDAILHFSWVRSDEDILKKVNGWSHSTDFNPGEYFKNVWKAAPKKWPFIYNFHPVWPKRWQALWPVSLNKAYTIS